MSFNSKMCAIFSAWGWVRVIRQFYCRFECYRVTWVSSTRPTLSAHWYANLVEDFARVCRVRVTIMTRRLMIRVRACERTSSMALTRSFALLRKALLLGVFACVTLSKVYLCVWWDCV